MKWYKKEGESIASGELLCDIQTDKAVVSMEADDDGVVAKILVAEGSSGVVVGKPIVVMVEEGEDWKDVAIPAAGGAAPAPKKEEKTAAAPAPAAAATAPGGGAQIAFVHPAQTGPATALLLSQYGVDPAKISGSGPKQNILKDDVLKYIAANGLKPLSAEVPLPKAATSAVAKADASAAAPRPRTGHVDFELSNMRKVIAKRLSDSKQTAPHGYSSATASIDKLMRFRKVYLNSGHKAHGTWK